MARLTVTPDPRRTNHCRRTSRIVQKVGSASGTWTGFLDNTRRPGGASQHDLLFAQVTQSDGVEEQENSEDTLARLGSRSG